ncbi:general substrate transporter [Talaromyces proteolyticus]|uniref:General substrate transporter n=1 Tax=Talaromyces proteolyticus TaxID=1131652 RepID=A0AAD4KGZ4_9EURO|nr:general substrate transporter [Talaromyces proteolyticus]KAH8691541.1 general substrate transporter [Talaromyces proteolyticus]
MASTDVKMSEPRVAQPIEFHDNKSALYHLRHNGRLIVTALLLSTAYFTFGYDGSVVGGVIAMPSFIKQFGHASTSGGNILPATDVSMITSVPVAGSFIGFLIATWMGDIFGRKKTMWLGCLVSLIGAAIQTASSNVATITVGRAFANIAIMIFLSMTSCFSNEIAPAPVRGAIVGLSIVLIDTASVVTSGVSWGTHENPTSFAYRLPLGLQVLWPLLIAAGLTFVSDSPTYFLIKGDDNRAYASLRKVRQGYTDDEIELEMQSLKYQESLRAEETEVSWFELFKGTNLRRTMLALSIGNFQQLSGIAFATNYATIFLTQIGSSNPYLLVLGLNILSLGGAVCGLFVVDWMGRRTLALSSFVVLFIIDMVVGGVAFADQTSPIVAKITAAFCLMFGFFFAAGFGPLTYIISSEMPTARLRNKTGALTFMSVSLFNMVVTFVLPYIANADEANLAAKTYLIFGGWMLGCIIITYFCLPETKGRSPAELDEMFNARVSTRNFRGYVCAVAPEHVEEAMGKCLSLKAGEGVQIEKLA